MNMKFVFLFFLLCQLNSVLGLNDKNSNKGLALPMSGKPAHLVPIYAADTRAHRLSLQKRLNSSMFIGSMGGQFPIYHFTKGRHQFQFELAGTTYIGLLRSINQGSVLNTDFFVDLFLNYKWHRNWALRFGTGHTSQHLSDDAIANLNFRFRNYARDYHQVGISYIGENNKFHVYGNFIYNYNFKVDSDISGKFTFQPGFELNINRLFFNSEKPGGFSMSLDAKFRGELNYRSTRNLQWAYQFPHLQNNKLKLVVNFTSGLEEIGQFYELNNNLMSAGVYAEF